MTKSPDTPESQRQPTPSAVAPCSAIDRLMVRWDSYIEDTERVIRNPEACYRAGVLEINRLRTVNSVRREMLQELRAALRSPLVVTDELVKQCAGAINFMDRATPHPLTTEEQARAVLEYLANK